MICIDLPDKKYYTDHMIRFCNSQNKRIKWQVQDSGVFRDVGTTCRFVCHLVTNQWVKHLESCSGGHEAQTLCCNPWTQILHLRKEHLHRSPTAALAGAIGARPSPVLSVSQAFLVYVQEAFCGCCTKPLLQNATCRAANLLKQYDKWVPNVITN